MSKLCHAILVEGGSPDRRMDKAVELLRERFNEDPAAAGKIAAGTFEDLIYLEPEEDKDIKTEQIEELIGLFNQRPFASTGKACVITRGERMNIHAQNKLLKLLEEPQGDDMIIILTENAQHLLPTVRSRLMRVWLGYAEPAQIDLTKDIRALTAALIYGKGTLAEANRILAVYEGSREEAADFVGAFRLFMRSLAVGRVSASLTFDDGAGEWIAESAAGIQKEHADRMRDGVVLAEKAILDIERGYRIRPTMRKMALSMRREN